MNKLLQIPKPDLWLGDLNSHSSVWGYQKTNKKGKNLEKIIQNNNLCILNKSHTYLNPFPAIDLTLCDPKSYIDYGWKVHDLCSSDHFSILLRIPQHLHERLPHWKLNKANWESLKSSANKTLPRPKHHRPNKIFYGNINVNSKRIYSKNLNLEQTQYSLVQWWL